MTLNVMGLEEMWSPLFLLMRVSSLEGSGVEVDPMVVDAFLGVQERIRAVDRREKT